MAYGVAILRNVGVALGLSLAVTVGSNLAAAGEGPWQVAKVGGDAWLQASDGSKTVLQEGDEIGPGSVVRSGSSGKVTVSRGQTAMTLSPNSEMEIPSDSDRGANTTVFQRSGALLLKVEKRPEQHFQVDTPFLAAVVKGTTFTVRVDDQASSVHVVEGAVEVGAFGTGDVALVRPGQTARVSPQNGGGLQVIGLNVPSGTGESEGRQGQADSDAGGNQASAEQGTAQTATSGMSGSKAGGLKIEETVGWDSIDVAAVSDGFVSAGVPEGMEAAAASGGRAAGQGGDVAANNVFGGTSRGAANSVQGTSNGLGATIQGTAAASPAATHGQAVSQVMHGLTGNGSDGSGTNISNIIGVGTGNGKGNGNGNGGAP